MLTKNEFQDEHEADNAALEFLEFAKLRSIYFENKFTHKTFLEYFAGYFIFSSYYVNHKNRRHFNQILDKNLGLSSWAVVLELLICKIDANLIDSVVLEEIINKQLEKNSNDALLFFLQILKYLNNVNERIVVNLARNAIKSCFATTFDLKESKIDHKEVLFIHLINLFKVDRFKSYVLKAFDREVAENVLPIDKLVIFAYEFSVTANNNSLSDLLNKYDVDTETPYIFLLKNHKGILSRQSYLENLKIFIVNFGVNATTPIYRSYFSQNILWGTIPFNWVITFFMTSKAENAYENYSKLREAGLTHAAMRNATTHKILSREVIEPYTKLIKGLPESNYRDFLKHLIKRYYPKSAADMDVNRKFYDAFYKQSNRNRRN